MSHNLTRQEFLKVAAGATAGLVTTGAAAFRGAAVAVIDRRDLGSYRIVLPDGAVPLERRAADVLRRHLLAATGRTLPVTPESAAATRPGIFIGATRFAAQQAGRSVLPAEGFRILGVGHDLLVVGGDARGTLHAVYGLLETWGFRLFASDARLTPDARSLGLPRRTVTAAPTIAYRTMLYADTAKGDYADWHHLSSGDQWGLFVHTFNELIPPERYGPTDPDFFSLIDGRRVPGTQLCLSNPRLRDTLIANLSERMAGKPEATYWSVSQNDNDRHCRCDACAAIDARHGGVPSGSILHFINQVARAFPAKTISTLAYWYSRTPPRNIRAEDNVNIMLCNIESRRHAPVHETDPGFSRDLVAWGAIAGNILIWDYEIQFTNLVSPFPNLHTIKPNIAFFRQNRVNALFMQANRDTGGEFAELRAYLIARLMWDPEADDDAIVDEFLDGYYGAAGRHIRRYIDMMRDRLTASRHALDIFGSPEGAKDSYLTAEALAAYGRCFDRAEHAVRDDPVLRARVAQARLPIIYARIQIARNEPVDAPRGLYVRAADGTVAARPELQALVERFVTTCKSGGVSRLRERSTSPDDYGASYRRIFANLAAVRDAKSLGRPVAVPAGGDGVAAMDRLTDGLFGSWESWSSPDPNWLAFTGRHLDAVVDLGSAVMIGAVETTFLNAQAQPDYNQLVLPRYVEVSFSDDGAAFSPPVRIDNPHDPDPRSNPGISSVPVHAFRHDVRRPIRARYVRVHAESILRMPSWHIMAGKPATIVTDQIVVS